MIMNNRTRRITVLFNLLWALGLIIYKADPAAACYPVDTPVGHSDVDKPGTCQYLGWDDCASCCSGSCYAVHTTYDCWNNGPKSFPIQNYYCTAPACTPDCSCAASTCTGNTCS